VKEKKQMEAWLDKVEALVLKDKITTLIHI